MSFQFFIEEEKVAKSSINIVQDSPRTGLGIPVKTKTLGRGTTFRL